MRTPQPKPNKLHDELDALLDGRPVELTDELAPLAEVAQTLRAELAGYQLDPQVAERHLERVLDGSAAVVQLPVRPQPHGWDLRRRVAAVVLAAALVLVPATMASAAALPGQAMYPFKWAIEELRIASVQWSPGREAVERTRVADERLEEVQSLTRLSMFNQLPTALNAFAKAVTAAKAAVEEARQKGEPVAKAQNQLNAVMVEGSQVPQAVGNAIRAAGQQGVAPFSSETLKAIETAVEKSQDALKPPAVAPADATATPPPNPSTTSAQPALTASSASGTQPPGSGTGSTQPPPTQAPTTTEPVTTTNTTQPPTTTSPPTSSVTSGSAGGGTTGGDDQAGLDGGSGDDVPTTTVAGP